MLIITPAVRGRLGRKIPGAQGDAGEKTQMGLRHPRPHGVRLLTGSFNAKHPNPSTLQPPYPVCYGLNRAPPHLTGASPTSMCPDLEAGVLRRRSRLDEVIMVMGLESLQEEETPGWCEPGGEAM